MGGPELATAASALRTFSGPKAHWLILAVLVSHLAPASMRSQIFANRPQSSKGSPADMADASKRPKDCQARQELVLQTPLQWSPTKSLLRVFLPSLKAPTATMSARVAVKPCRFIGGSLICPSVGPAPHKAPRDEFEPRFEYRRSPGCS
jgi:hypothetical protein